METGWYDIDNESYHMSKGISSTALKLMCDCPYKYKNRKAMTKTPALQLGSRVHGALLGDAPELVVVPKFDRRTKAGKLAYTEFYEQYSDTCYDFCTLEEYEVVTAMRNAVLAHSDAAALLDGGVYEQAGYYESECYGLLKVKPDIRRDDMGMIADVKTIGTSASPDVFTRQAMNLHYHMSAAFYMDISSAIAEPQYDKWVWIVVESKPPHTVAVYYASTEMIERGRELYVSALDKLIKCKNADEWPAYPTQMLQLPTWAQ